MNRSNHSIKKQGGAVIVEYALVMAIIVVNVAWLCAPRPGNPVFSIIRAVYRRIVIVISMPWL